MDYELQHQKVIDSFLKVLNVNNNRYILKGGTALLKCYGLDRFSEDIDLDGSGNSFVNICHKFAMMNNYECIDAKNTEFVKRCMIHYGGIKPLKIEMSARRKIIGQNETIVINGILTYTIDMMAILKVGAYEQRDKIRDLYDVVFIINNYFDKLNMTTKFAIQNAFQYKGLEYFDYITNTQKDELVDINKLTENFLKAYEKVGLIKG